MVTPKSASKEGPQRVLRNAWVSTPVPHDWLCAECGGRAGERGGGEDSRDRWVSGAASPSLFGDGISIVATGLPDY